MKKIYLLGAAVALASTINAQVVFQTSIENWSSGLPIDMYGTTSNIGAANVAQVSGSSSYGTESARLTNATTTHKRFTTLPMSVTNLVTYEIKFWVKGIGDIRTGMFDGRSTGFGYATYNSYISVNSTSWAMYSQTVTCANDTTAGEFIFSVRNTVAPDHIMLDSIIISVTTSTPTNASIYQIQHTTTSPYDSPYMGQYVNTGGIVTGYYSTGYFVQAGNGAWHGVMVYDTINTAVSGDSITFTALVEEYFNNTRLNSVTGFNLVSSSNPVPNPTVITTTQGNTEDFEGCLVKATAPCTDDNAGFGMWVIYTSPDSLKIDNLMYSFTPTIGLTYEVIGCIEYSFSEFKLDPRKPSDVTVISGIDELSTGNSFIMYPNPSGTYANLVNVDASAAVTLFDIYGKQIVTTRGNYLYTANLENGTYLVKIITPTGTKSAKLIVQH